MLRFTSVLLFLYLFSINIVSAQQTKIRVAVASSLMPAMKEIKAVFEANHQVQIELIPGASGTLANQALLGAPYDIFISANKKYSQILFDAGLLQRNPEDWINGELIFWSQFPIGSATETPSSQQIVELLTAPNIKTIATAQPGLAPYGDAAKSYLSSLKVYDSIEHKLIYGNNISITNQYIYTISADVVITSSASKYALEKQVGGLWIPLGFNADLSHTVCLMQASDSTDEFYNFLFSEPSLTILGTFGYIQL